MKWLSSLKNRVFAASTLLAVLPIAFAIRFVTARAERDADAELERRLQDAAMLVEHQYGTRLETLALMARLIADLPKLKAAVATDDPPTVQPLALDYQARVHADHFAVMNRQGRTLVTLGGAPGEDASRNALAGRETTVSRAVPGGVLQIVTVPILIGPEPPEALGSLSLGFALDDALAAEWKALTESEVAFARGGRVLASSLAQRHDAELALALTRPSPAMLRLDDDDYVAVHRSLGTNADGSGEVVALILRSRTERLQFLRTFRAALGLAAVGAVLVAVVLSYMVASSVTRPLAVITAGMREMAATGDLTRKIRLRSPGWDDEDARLVAASFNTLTDAIARFQKEAAQRERLSALGRLSMVVAHEIRNPLMIIKASLRILRRPGAGREETREAIADIDHEVSRLDGIVDDVLDFARPVRIRRALTDVNAVCREAAAAAESAGTAPAVRLDLDRRLPLLATDAERLRATLVNVLSNARAAVLARDAGGHPAIELRTAMQGEARVAIVVADQGIGIEPRDLPHVFDPYFTTRPSGTGLGLAIAKNIVDSLGGTITARSVIGEGTEVQIELPVSAAAHTPVSETSSPGEAG